MFKLLYNIKKIPDTCMLPLEGSPHDQCNLELRGENSKLISLHSVFPFLAILRIGTGLYRAIASPEMDNDHQFYLIGFFLYTVGVAAQ